jgi:hypothetical protein
LAAATGAFLSCIFGDLESFAEEIVELIEAVEELDDKKSYHLVVVSLLWSLESWK